MPEFISDDWFMLEGDVRAAFIIFELLDIVQCNQSHTAHNLYRALLLSRQLVHKCVDERVPSGNIYGLVVNPMRRTWEVLVVHPVFSPCMPTADLPHYLLRDARNMIFTYEEARLPSITITTPRDVGPRRVIF